MRIAILSDAWLPQVNGVVRTLDTTRKLLSAQGHIVEMFGPDRFRTVPCPTYPEIRLSVLPGRKLARLLDGFAPEAIHIATEGPIGMAGRSYCKRRGVPFTTSFHTKFPEYVEARTRIPASLSYRWLRHFHGAAARTMVATQSLEDELHQVGFANLARWTRGVDTELFHPRADVPLDLPRPVFAYIGRVAVEKNIEAFLKLDLPGSKLVVGDGPQRPELQKRFPDATYVGAKFGEDLARHYAMADVFVFPSLTDTFGLVLLEALASGVPVAAFPVTGPRDVLAGAPVGVLDADLGKAARAALTLDRAACRDYALGFSWEASVRQFLDNLAPFGGTEMAKAA